MARLPRLFVPDCPMLIELQGVAGLPVFTTKASYLAFIECLRLSAEQMGSRIHAFCLIANKVQLLASMRTADEAGKLVQSINRKFIPKLHREGISQASTLWEPRFRSTVVQPGNRSLTAMLFVEQLALRDRITLDLSSYPWSSFQHHEGSVPYTWLAQLAGYWQLGNTPFDRQSAYGQFAQAGLSKQVERDLSACLKKGWIWADDDFCQQVAALANRSIRPRRRGRPSKDAQK